MNSIGQPPGLNAYRPTVTSTGATGETSAESNESLQEGTLETGHVPLSGSATGSSRLEARGMPSPKDPIPSAEEIQKAYDGIDWENPDISQVLKLLSMISANLKKSMNDAKWAQKQSEISGLMTEASKIKEAGATRMWTQIGMAAVEGAVGVTSAVANLKAFKSVGTAVADFNSNILTGGLFDVAIKQIDYKAQIATAVGQITSSIGKGGGAIGDFAASVKDGESKEAAARATSAAAQNQEAQSAESNADELLKKIRETIEQLAQQQIQTEKAIVNA